MIKPRVVIFLGDDVFPTGKEFFEARRIVAKKIGMIVAKLAKKYEIVLTYQNIFEEKENIFQKAERAAIAASLAMPSDISLAGEQGKNGYILEVALRDALARSGQNKKLATVITQSVVEKNNSTSKKIDRPVGRIYSEKEALKLIKTQKWVMREVKKGKYQRFLPVVSPIDLVERREINDLLMAGTIVIAESGSIPVYRTKVLKTVKNIEAVVESDFAAEKLAELLRADIFVSVTARTAVYLKTEESEIALRELMTKEARNYLKYKQFAPEITEQKIEAHIKFAKRQKVSVICGLSNLEDALKGKSGTNII